MAIDAFLEAAAYAGTLVASDRGRSCWSAPSALDLMTVGAVVGHMFLVVRRVGQRAEGLLPDPSGAPQGQLPASSARDWTWLRVGRPEDLEEPNHREVRQDVAHVATWGWEAVRDAYQERIEKVSLLLCGDYPADVHIAGRRLPFPDYVATRVVELVVHADDVACSVDLEATPPQAALDVSVSTMVEAARSVHGDLAVLRALTRRERTVGDLSVF
jgi:hypothetical protein